MGRPATVEPPRVPRGPQAQRELPGLHHAVRRVPRIAAQELPPQAQHVRESARQAERRTVRDRHERGRHRLRVHDLPRRRGIRLEGRRRDTDRGPLQQGEDGLLPGPGRDPVRRSRLLRDHRALRRRPLPCVGLLHLHGCDVLVSQDRLRRGLRPRVAGAATGREAGGTLLPGSRHRALRHGERGLVGPRLAPGHGSPSVGVRGDRQVAALPDRGRSPAAAPDPRAPSPAGCAAGCAACGPPSGRNGRMRAGLPAREWDGRPTYEDEDGGDA